MLIIVGVCIKHSCIDCCTVFKTNVEMPGAQQHVKLGVANYDG